MQLNVKDLIWDRDTYAREQTSNNTVEQYTAALSAGAQFPPIQVERLANYPGQDGNVVVSIRDGYHRWAAHQRQEVATIEAEFWTDDVLDYSDRAVRCQLKAQSAFYNKQHGDRTSEKDKRETARYIAENDPEKVWGEQAIADKVGAPPSTIHDWIADIRAKQRASRAAAVYRLDRLGWTGAKTSALLGVDPSTVSRILHFPEFGKMQESLQRRVDEDKVDDLIRDAVEEYRLDTPLAWALRLDGQSDLDRFGMAASNDDAKNLKWGPQPFDFWHFGQCDTRFGDDWPGRIPAQIVGHVLYFFSEQGDLIMDPMAGGGVVPDVCLALNRKCRAFDLVPGTSEDRAHQRPEIEHWYWEPGAMKWPDVKPDLIFWDPPYFSKKDAEYTERADGQISLSSLPRDEYLEFFRQWFALAKQHVKPTTTLAFLMSDWNDDATDEGIFIWDYARLLQDTGWRLIRHIQAPLSTQSFGGDFVNKFRESKRLGRLERYLLIAK